MKDKATSTQLTFDGVSHQEFEIKKQPWISSVSIVADSAEETSGIPALLRKRGAQVQVAPLTAGDYVVQNRTMLERKTAADLWQSVYQGRLFRQLKAAQGLFPEFLLLVEGGQWAFERVKPEPLQGALLAVMLSWKVPIAFTKDVAGTVDLLLAIGRRNLRQPQARLAPVGRKRRAFSKEEGQLQVLGYLPDVGPRLAKRLLDKFNTIEGVAKASEEDLQSVDGVGREKAKKIQWILREPQAGYGKEFPEP